MNPPYKIIYAGGEIARHIGTLIVTDEVTKDRNKYGITTHSHPIVDYGDSNATGQVWDMKELKECSVLQVDKNEKITWKDFNKLVENHFVLPNAFSQAALFVKRRLEDLGIKDVIVPSYRGRTIQVELLFEVVSNWVETGTITKAGAPELIINIRTHAAPIDNAQHLFQQCLAYEAVLSELYKRPIEIVLSTKSEHLKTAVHACGVMKKNAERRKKQA